MATITRTVITPVIYQEPYKANYTISGVEDSELSTDTKQQLHATVFHSVGSSYELASAVTTTGLVTVKNITGDTLTVTSASGTIDGGSSILLIDDEALTVKSDGTNWHIV